MSSIDQELTGEDIAAQVMGFISGGSDADTAEAPAGDVESGIDTETGESRPEVTEDSNGRLRGPDGKFVARETVDGDGEESDDGSGQELDDDGFVIEVDDEETAAKVQSYLEKYGGDVTKALIGATEAQSLIGRKGNETARKDAELVAVKEELERLSRLVTETASRPPLVPITQDMIEQDPAAAAQQAVLQDNLQAFQAAIAAWQEGTLYAEPNPQAAQLFLEKLALESQLAELSTGPAAAGTSGDLDAEVAKVMERHPDLENYLSQIAAAAGENLLLKNAMENGTPAEAAQALEALTIIAKSRTGSDTSKEQMAKVQIRVKQEADAARASARVVSASRGSAATESPSEGKDQFLAAFEARLGIDTSGN